MLSSRRPEIPHQPWLPTETGNELKRTPWKAHFFRVNRKVTLSKAELNQRAEFEPRCGRPLLLLFHFLSFLKTTTSCWNSPSTGRFIVALNTREAIFHSLHPSRGGNIERERKTVRHSAVSARFYAKQDFHVEPWTRSWIRSEEMAVLCIVSFPLCHALFYVARSCRVWKPSN